MSRYEVHPEWLLNVVIRNKVQVQVQVCFTSVCGQVQPLDVALSNSVQHSQGRPDAIWLAWSDFSAGSGHGVTYLSRD
jgi:hypothetical protein